MLFTHTFQFHQLIYEYINWIYQLNQPKCISFQIKQSISIAWSLIYILPCVWLFDLHTFGFWFSHHCLTATKISLCHCRLSYFLPNFLKKVHFVPWFRITSKWENIYACYRVKKLSLEKMVCHAILFYILLYLTQLYFILSYSTWPYSTLSYTILLYCILLY